MRTLHVAAMPFPSQQGTQALVHTIAGAMADAGHETHLLCYPHSGFERATRYTVHRSIDRGRDRSLRSGPSLRKVVQDAQLVRDLRRLHAALHPAQVVTHHVEAAWAAHLAGIEDVTFVAHTSLSGELASYFPKIASRPLTLLGRMIDRAASRPASRRLAVSPALQDRMQRETDCAFDLLTPPWSVHTPIEEAERRTARASFGLDDDARVLLYAGNLDAYQGLDVLCAGLTRACEHDPRLRWLVATSSAPDSLSESSALLRSRTHWVALEDDAARRKAHAAADLALVPRKSPGGIPIKLLDALAHGVPVLACARATAGFEFGPACFVIADDDPSAWVGGLSHFFDLSQQHRRAFSHAAREVVGRQHSPDVCVRALLLHAR